MINLGNMVEKYDKRMRKGNHDKISAEQDDKQPIVPTTIPHKIIIIGTGGAGNNTISMINENDIENIYTIAINTDAQDLINSQADEKILIGKKTCKGLGASGKPDIGKKSAEESEDEIKEKLDGADMVFITCGLGGGTGTGSAPIIAKLAKEADILTVAVVTMPLSVEGIQRKENAENGLKKLQNNVDTVILVPNDKILEITPDLSLQKVFLASDMILCHVVKGITDLLTKQSLHCVDFADITCLMQESGMAVIGMGESDSKNRALESIHEAMNSPLLYMDVSSAKGALINIIGSSDISLYDSEKIVQFVIDKLDPEANIAWGALIDDSLESTIRTTIIISGINPNLNQNTQHNNKEDNDPFMLNNSFLPDRKFKI